MPLHRRWWWSIPSPLFIIGCRYPHPDPHSRPIQPIHPEHAYPHTNIHPHKNTCLPYASQLPSVDGWWDFFMKPTRKQDMPQRERELQTQGRTRIAGSFVILGFLFFGFDASIGVGKAGLHFQFSPIMRLMGSRAWMGGRVLPLLDESASVPPPLSAAAVAPKVRLGFLVFGVHTFMMKGNFFYRRTLL